MNGARARQLRREIYGKDGSKTFREYFVFGVKSKPSTCKSHARKMIGEGYTFNGMPFLRVKKDKCQGIIIADSKRRKYQAAKVGRVFRERESLAPFRFHLAPPKSFLKLFRGKDYSEEKK